MFSKHKGMEVFFYEFNGHKILCAEQSFSRINVLLFTMMNRIILTLAHVFIFVLIFSFDLILTTLCISHSLKINILIKLY